jgi:hypothetical protein
VTDYGKGYNKSGSSSNLNRAGSGRPGSGRGNAPPQPNGKKTEVVSQKSTAEFKKEKEAQIAMINAEIKKYDLEEMKSDINYKMATNINNLRKN